MGVDSRQTCRVYWIHLPGHSDITTEGYIGITTLGVDESFKRHISAAKCSSSSGRKSRIVHAINKYGERLCVSTLLTGTLEYCQLIENKLRPSENIGWNIAPGGANTRAGLRNSPEHNRKVAEANRGRKLKPEHVKEMRERLKLFYTFENPWDHPYINKAVWARCFDIYAYFISQKVTGRRSVGKALSLPPDSVDKPLKKMKQGWNPHDDPAYISWLSEYNKKEKGDANIPQPSKADGISLRDSTSYH